MQENESLEFRNQQLSKRVSLLQEEIASPNKKKKKVRVACALVRRTYMGGVRVLEIGSRYGKDSLFTSLCPYYFFFSFLSIHISSAANIILTEILHVCKFLV